MFTPTQSSILAILFDQENKEYYLSEVGEIIGKKPGVFQRGLNSLERQGFILSRKRGNQRLIKINREHPLFKEMKTIIQKTHGAETLIRQAIKNIQGIYLAFIY